MTKSSTIGRRQLTLQAPVFKKTFDKLLVANRGEIACRIIKTARKMGIRTVAVYSDLDYNALHVQLADEAVHLGPGPSTESYLSIDRILNAARQTGADAIHPGYGFLSENPAFVRVIEAEGIKFVGPSAHSIAAMGDKIQSKLIARASKVNCIPGYDGEVYSVSDAIRVAHDITYPVMIKASAGGGGKELEEGYKLAKQESLSAFGDDRLLIEKYIDSPRHIEIQVLGDHHGNAIYFPERDCSIQRRNQKVIEESPSMHLDEKTRKEMGLQAIALARHVGYNSAGTVEFLVDASRNFYFLEMNTRLQVEHPITECVTGVDLVEHMLYSAAGYPLSLTQNDIRINGWAIESRVYAEDPEKYLPSVGRLLTYQEPSPAADVRCDSGFMEGSDIHMEYDPLICKLVTCGASREQAVDTMVRALDEYVIKGVTHNLPLLRGVISHPRFRQGENITTQFLAEEYPDGIRNKNLSGSTIYEIAAVSGALWAKMELAAYPDRNKWSVWVQMTEERSQKTHETRIELAKNGESFEAVGSLGKLCFSMRWPLNGLLARTSFEGKDDLIVQFLDMLDHGFKIHSEGSTFKVIILNDQQYDLRKHMKQKPEEEKSRVMLSPMPGKVISLAVSEGDEVTEGSELAVVEAMKMQNVLRTSRVGRIKRIHVQKGHTVGAGQVLIEFDDNREYSL
ncbi:hypothetical protein DFQ28_003606 [Apophysomyces sp. BC1034]|nr:hypothetical protein DFQ30_003547 [Apophysomyces sp. BC1015]KAG0175796.1 hypothetical protein DFQ29_007003 [Apophysomyces sp. BC1021]KAG0189283.1 hypothetical protein DFQ28_003606 [Apophysomyces sp. BC1034]